MGPTRLDVGLGVDVRNVGSNTLGSGQIIERQLRHQGVHLRGERCASGRDLAVAVRKARRVQEKVAPIGLFLNDILWFMCFGIQKCKLLPD